MLEAFVKLSPQLVVPVLDHRVQHRPRAIEQAHEDAVLDRPRQPPGRLLAQTVVELVAVLVQVLVESAQCGVDDLYVTAVLRREAQRAPREGREWCRFDAGANDAVDGSPSRSFSHSPAISSTTAAAGPPTTSPAF